METCPCGQKDREEATRDNVKGPTVPWLIHPTPMDGTGIRHAANPTSKYR